MNERDLDNLRDKLFDIKHKYENIKGDVEQVRRYFKHQNDSTDSISEDLVVIYHNNDIGGLIESIDELIDICEE